MSKDSNLESKIPNIFVENYEDIMCNLHKYINKEYVNYYTNCIIDHTLNLEDVPLEYRTENVCLQALYINIDSLQHVPIDLRIKVENMLQKYIKTEK